MEMADEEVQFIQVGSGGRCQLVTGQSSYVITYKHLN